MCLNVSTNHVSPSSVPSLQAQPVDVLSKLADVLEEVRRMQTHAHTHTHPFMFFIPDSLTLPPYLSLPLSCAPLALFSLSLFLSFSCALLSPSHIRLITAMVIISSARAPLAIPSSSSAKDR